VETAAQAEMLQRWQCSEARGYFYSRPLPATDVEPLLRAGRV
jgi:EAL domain-containing protein (putative c-di-GMP-specific phosphodiesterase class I)